MALTDQIIGAESGGDSNARNPNSSASGVGQFIDSTWLSMLAKHRPDLVDGRSRDELLTLKSDPNLSRDMTAAYAADNAGILTKAGLPVTPGTTYLAHFAGPKGAVGILNADPGTPVDAVLGRAAVAANPFLKGKTASDLAAWADRKMGDKGAGPAAPMSFAGPVVASGAAPPTDSEVTTQPAGQGTEAGTPQAHEAPFSLTSLMTGPAEQQRMPPMLLPQRPRIDLSRIRPALSRVFYSRG